MLPHENYRQLAAEQLREAERTNLPLVRNRHLRAAAKWEAMASEVEVIMVGRRSASMV